MNKAMDLIESAITDYIAGDIPDEILQVAKGW